MLGKKNNLHNSTYITFSRLTKVYRQKVYRQKSACQGLRMAGAEMGGMIQPKGDLNNARTIWIVVLTQISTYDKATQSRAHPLCT